MYVDGICVINVFIYSWIQSPIFTSFAQQIRRSLCVHHDLLLPARICLHLFQRIACIMERSIVIWFRWGQKWIVAFRCGTFLFVLIIIFKYCDRRRTDVGPTSAGDINPTSKRRWADIARPISTQRRPNTCSLVVFFFDSIICLNYFAPKSSQCWKQRSILVQSCHGYRPTLY